MLRKGEWVWLDSDIGVPIGARVKETPSGQRFLVDDDGKERRLPQEQEASLRIMHPTSVEGVDDMIKLGDLTEAGLLRNLMLRHKQGIIYTYTSSVLVAVNPYQDFPLYTAEQVRLYRGRRLGELPPHIFAIAENCHFNMTRHRRNQCCIISGESGAGKTESTKLILQYLAAISGELSEQRIEQQILESNPILEAFGNAKTIRNDNSSRFGKYLEIFFNKDGMIEGARVEQYLLEKSRVCHQAEEERNYHIFYCLLSGIPQEEKAALRLGRAKEYRFLTQGNCTTCEGRDDAKDYSRICSAMKILNFSHSHCQEISKLLAAILHLGNVYFEATTENNLETSDVGKSEHFSIAASLLQVQKSSLAKTLTHRSFMTNRERVTKPLNSEQASDCRDAFVKSIYNKLFIWITGKINSVIYKKLANNPKSQCLSIGLLDIFGFENFDTNSFEQLCINFANEKLQQFFVGHIFKLEQEEYMKEDIVWNNISFSDNQEILDLLAGKPCNLLALIDEESHFPKGSDSTMLTKMNKEHKGNKVYKASKSEYDAYFGVNHFAGVVCYDSRGFLEKNRDAVSFDIIKMVDVSSNNLLHQIFASELSNNTTKNIPNRRFIMTPNNSLRAQSDNHKQLPTLSGQFRQSLDSLMKALSVCQPYFIRCFKPNSDKLSEVFDRELCMRQLRYSGMMDTIRIRKLGFPIRHTFQEFLSRYRVLLKTRVCDPKMVTAAACCEAICKAVIEGEDEWKRGRTKIFLKDAHDAILEREREDELNRVAVVIQRVMLGHKDRKSFLKKRRAAVVLQRNWRAYMDGSSRRKITHGYERLVAKVRSRNLQLQHQRQRAAAVTIQAQVRGYWVRKDIKKQQESAILMQAYIRGFLARKATKIRNKSPPVAAQQEMDDQEQMALEILDEATEDSESATTEQDSEETVHLRSAHAEDEERLSVPARQDDVSGSTSSSSASSLEEGDQFDDDDDDDELSFYRFSLQHFQGDATHAHITDRLRQPLLRHDDEGDALACLTVWWIILRFMGDRPEPKPLDTASEVSFQRNLPRRGRRLSSLVGLDEKILRRKKKAGNRRASTIPEEPEDLTEDEQILIGEGPTLDRPLSALEKLHVIVGHGLSRQGIRDEIYCQICKQLVNNKNKNSSMQGWILLSVCLGIFPPTDLFLQYLERFLRRGPNGYNAYCAERLRRTIANGARKERPCWIELQAARSIEPIHKRVALMDGRIVDLELESASTSAEVCKDVAAEIGLKDTYGFSLYISFQDKTWSLGSCGKHVLDAVSHCEHEMRRQGMEEKDAPWSLCISKELFTPWHECAMDPVSTDLIYRQVIKRVKAGEYISGKEDNYLQLAVKHYYIQFGSVSSRENAQKVVEGCIATTLIENKSMKNWIELISAAHSQSPYVSGMYSKERVKGELVDSARQEWRVHFSRFYEVTMMSGPPLSKSRFIVAVNWSTILFMDERDKTLLEIPYVEVKGVDMISDGPFSAQSVILATLRGQYVLKSAEASDMYELIKMNLDGLRERSTFALAFQDVSQPDDPMFLACERGDLLLVDKLYKYPSEKNLVKATNHGTSCDGAVHKDVLQFLATLTMPNDEVLQLIKNVLRGPGPGRISVDQSPPIIDETVAPVSLKEFALDNFRPAAKDTGRHGASKAVSREKLWDCTKEPLKQPLLKSLVGNSDLSYLACNAFIAILKYMGDYPIKQVRSPVELTDQIFGPATQHEALQDEIYCQIMRQMTRNTNRLSVDRGWHLMWLCTGLFPPSHNLMKHTQRWLESRPKDLLSTGCLHRMQQMCSMEPRKFPPHFVEVEAIQQNSTQIFQKVHFPDDTNDIFEVTSTTTIRDLRCSIASELRLTSADGYGLYLKTPTKITSMDEEKYFFDDLRQKSDVPKKGKKVKDVNPASIPYLVICKRKLWFNVSPGKDEVADLTFHFPQEVPKYLRGYHNCTKEDMFNLGGLLFRVKVDSDRNQFVMIPRMLKDLVPADQLKSMSADEWKKNIMAAYNRQSGITVQEAKIAFLKSVSSWPTFGCAFFDVKQTCEPSYPNRVLIAISKQGLSLIDPTTKGLLVMHPFSRITEYHSRGNSFQMSIGTLVRGNNFICETSQAHTMEDLLKSYVAMYEIQRNHHQAFLPRNLRFS